MSVKLTHPKPLTKGKKLTPLPKLTSKHNRNAAKGVKKRA